MLMDVEGGERGSEWGCACQRRYILTLLHLEEVCFNNS